MEPNRSDGIARRPAKGVIAKGRCVMCQGRPATTLLDIDIARPCTRMDDVVEMIPKARTWKLCRDCNAAIQHEVAHANNDAPRGLYIALAVVASQRGQPVRSPIWTARYWQDTDARTREGWMVRLILLLFLSPVIALIGSLILAAVSR